MPGLRRLQILDERRLFLPSQSQCEVVVIAVDDVHHAHEPAAVTEAAPVDLLRVPERPGRAMSVNVAVSA